MMTEHINPPWNFSWVVSEKLAAMAWPQTEANLQYIFQQGVRHLVTLSPEKLPPAHKCPDLAWTVIGIEEFEAPSIDQIQEFIRICEQCDKNKQVSKVYQLYHMYSSHINFLLLYCRDQYKCTFYHNNLTIIKAGLKLKYKALSCSCCLVTTTCVWSDYIQQYTEDLYIMRTLLFMNKNRLKGIHTVKTVLVISAYRYHFLSKLAKKASNFHLN